MVQEQRHAFIRSLHRAEIIQFGEFKLKSGVISPFYIDMRRLVAFPKLMTQLSLLVQHTLGKTDPSWLVCGVPYGAIPVAVAFALGKNLPLLLLRKERKGYGQKKQIEGLWDEGQSVVLMEDVITSGESIWESIEAIEQEGLRIAEVVVFVDRQQGGAKRLSEKGYSVRAVFSITEIVQALQDELTPEKIEAVYHFIRETKPSVGSASPMSRLTPHPLAQRLVELALLKKSNLILSADVHTTEELWHIVRSCASHIVALKLHADMIDDFSLDFATRLKDFAREHHFLLIEDRKLADIGNTQYLQATHGTQRISQWADMVTVHFIAGENAVEALAKEPSLGLLGIVEMSSKGTLTDSTYIQQSLNIMETLSPLFVGAVCQKAKLRSPFLKFSPGIHLSASGDALGQQYQSPAHAISEQGTDFIIVGRGIYATTDPKASAIAYQSVAWQACEHRLSDYIR